MNRRSHLTLPALIVPLLLGLFTTGLALEPSVVARFDLEHQGDFQNFKNLDITPFFRMGNVFFAEVDQSRLSTARGANIPYAVVDDQPFVGHYYVGTIESFLSRKTPAPELELLTEVGEHALYKTAQPIDPAEYHLLGFEPIEVRKREIPLTYFTLGTASPNPSVAAFDPDLDSLIAVISQDSIYAYNTRLEAFQTRLTFSDSNLAARDWIKQKFESFGYTDVSLDQFWVNDNRYGGSGWTHNVVCVKEGTAEPDKVIVIGGHYDSIVYDGNDPYVYAPGSDDNGSGTTATLEIARVLAGLPIKKTIIFVAFSAEESGLEGSWHFASDAYYSGMDIELMINMDMIGYTEDAYPNVECSYLSSSRPYSELMALMAEQYTWLYPEVMPAGGGSDHYPFSQYGFNIANTIESDFNYPGWHTQLDLTSRMDFPYLTEVTRMCLATLYTVALNPSTIADAAAWDVGDGQSLQVEWTPLSAPDIAGYRVYWGTESENYTDSAYVSGGSTSQVTIGGLVEHQLYYLTMVAVDTEGRESFLRPEFTGTPRVVPFPPADVLADPAFWQVELSWSPNRELDFDHYNIYRSTQPGTYPPLVEDLMSTEYIDTDVSAGVMYEYTLTAVDSDGNESEYSESVTAAAATFDQGMLIVDATPPIGANPSAEDKDAFFNAVFAGLPTAYYYYNPVSDDLNKSIIGQYQAVFWFDDGNAAGEWKEDDIDKLRWYLNYNTNLLLAGWRVAFEFSGFHVPKEIYPGNLLFDYAGVTYIDQVTDVDFVGALGHAPFPDVAIDPDKAIPSWHGKMGWIGVLGLMDENNAIYRFDSYSGEHAGKIVGVRRDNGTNKFVFLSMPFYYLQDEDAQASISKVITWFGVEQSCNCSQFGDADRDGNINPVDVVLMVNYVYMSLSPPLSIPPCFQGEPAINGDWNCDGAVNPVDMVLLVNHVYQDGPGPCDPCQCDPYPSNCP